MRPPVHERHELVLRFIREGNWEGAEKACQELTSKHPDFVLGWYLGAQIAVRRTGLSAALGVLERALALAPTHPPALLLKAQCLAATGRLTEAVAVAGIAQAHAPPEAAFWDALGQVLSRSGEQLRALTAYEEALRLTPGNARVLSNRAAVRALMGDLTGAEQDYDRVIALNPEDFEAHRARSELRPQTSERNHIAELTTALSRHKPAWRGEVQLRYALAKEHEDLGEHDKSYEQLKLGARLRREHMRYDIKTDVATVNWLREAFPEVIEPPAPDAAGPLFLVGLPYAGADHVEQLLARHPPLTAAGELDCFARALMEAVRRGSPGRLPSRREMIARSRSVDFAALGRAYVEKAQAARASGGRFIDRHPLNYLYCGLIRRALPQARIVHVSRTPLSACHAVHKTLSEDRYPFSYDLTELGQYYIAYRWLMAHWARTLPGALYELSYERLVADEQAEIRRLLQFCGVQWDDAAVDASLAPADALPPAKPVCIPAVSQWRHYETPLAGLRGQLTAAGIDVEQANP